MRKSVSQKNKLKKILFGIATLGLVTFVGTKAGKLVNNRRRKRRNNQRTGKTNRFYFVGDGALLS